MLWTLPGAGALMLLGHAAWPAAALIGGATSVDTAGREMARLRALGTVGLWVTVYALIALV